MPEDVRIWQTEMDEKDTEVGEQERQPAVRKEAWEWLSLACSGVLRKWGELLTGSVPGGKESPAT